MAFSDKNWSFTDKNWAFIDRTWDLTDKRWEIEEQKLGANKSVGIQFGTMWIQVTRYRISMVYLRKDV